MLFEFVSRSTIQDPRPRVLDVESRILDPGRSIEDPERRTFVPEAYMEHNFVRERTHTLKCVRVLRQAKLSLVT